MDAYTDVNIFSKLLLLFSVIEVVLPKSPFRPVHDNKCLHYLSHTFPCLRILSLKHLSLVTHSVTLAPVWAEGPSGWRKLPLWLLTSAWVPFGLVDFRLGWGSHAWAEGLPFGLRASRLG